VHELKKKLVRCINYVISEDSQISLENIKFKIYIPQFEDKKQEVLRMIFCCRKKEFFNFSGEELKNNNEMIYNLKISPHDLILVEIISKNENNWLLHLEKEIKVYNCFYCKIEIENVIRCNFCSEVIHF
jgi:hypothetical protein